MRNYTQKLLEKGEERRRLTEQLQELASRVAEEIATSVPEGTEVEVNGRNYRAKTLRSNIGSYTTLVAVNKQGWDEGLITDRREPGQQGYLHGDFYACYTVAGKEVFLHFVNNLPEIVRAFEAEEDRIIAALREAFEKLRTLAEKEI